MRINNKIFWAIRFFFNTKRMICLRTKYRFMYRGMARGKDVVKSNSFIFILSLTRARTGKPLNWIFKNLKIYVFQNSLHKIDNNFYEYKSVRKHKNKKLQKIFYRFVNYFFLTLIKICCKFHYLHVWRNSQKTL